MSLEIFPPKKSDDISTVLTCVKDMARLKPDYISVTFGAGGKNAGTSLTAEVATTIKAKHKIEPLVHLTASGVEDVSIEEFVASCKKNKIENILALRGDDKTSEKYKYAKDLIKDLKAVKNFNLSIAAAAYPEGHITSQDLNLDIEHLKQKQDAGADFFITQLFFDNEIFYRFLEKAKAKQITIPISAGIMPIMSKSQIERMIYMCGASLPSSIIKLVNKYGESGEDLIRAGVEYATKQMQDLIKNGVDGIHIYTMNKPFIAEYCMKRI